MTHGSAPGRPRLVTESTCPRCGSAEVRRLSLVHQVGLTASGASDRGQSTISRYAAPPEQKSVLPWTLIAIAATGLAVGSYASARPGTLVMLAAGVMAIVVALRAARYNAKTYPELQKLWAHSFMCARCGEIFSSRHSERSAEGA